MGSFPAGGNFYFQGDETQFLQQEENIQVLTPTLTKSFEPSQIAPIVQDRASVGRFEAQQETE